MPDALPDSPANFESKALPGPGVTIDSRGRRWVSALHPRDSKGRFIETGGVARVWGRGLARVLRVAPGNRVEVEYANGGREIQPAYRLSMVRRADGTKPTKSREKVMEGDARRDANAARPTANTAGELDGEDRGDNPQAADLAHDPADEDIDRDEHDVATNYTASREQAVDGDRAFGWFKNSDMYVGGTLRGEGKNAALVTPDGTQFPVAGFNKVNLLPAEDFDQERFDDYVAAQNADGHGMTGDEARAITNASVHDRDGDGIPDHVDTDNDADRPYAYYPDAEVIQAAGEARDKHLRLSTLLDEAQMAGDDDRERDLWKQEQAAKAEWDALEAEADIRRAAAAEAERARVPQGTAPGSATDETIQWYARRGVKPGARVMVGDAPGTVEEITYRSTKVRLDSGEQTLVPHNSTLDAPMIESAKNPPAPESADADTPDLTRLEKTPIAKLSDSELQQIVEAEEMFPPARAAAAYDQIMERLEAAKSRPSVADATAAESYPETTTPSTQETPTDEPAVSEPDPELLDDVPAQRGREDEPGRSGAVLPESGEGRGRGDRGRDDAEPAAVEPAGGQRGDAGEAEGDGAGEGDRGSAGRPGVPAEGAGDRAQGAADDAAVVDAAQRGVAHPSYRPASQQDLAGGESVDKKQRARENLAALQTLRAIQAEGREYATAEEQAVMAKWGGMGAIRPLFTKTGQDRDWKKLHDEFRKVVPDDAEWEALKDNAANAHYTDYAVVDAMWGALESFGFERGNVLEPGSGLGNFIFRAPEGATVHGVEVEPNTAAIAQLLSPQARIRNEDFGRTRPLAGAFDAAIGNVPFGNYRVFDSKFNPKLKKRIHDHFIEKSLASVKPGGVMAIVTSAGTLDKGSAESREAIYKHADLVGAVRLPNGAHKDAADTDVATDVLLFRVRKPGEAPGDDSWLTSSVREHPNGTPVVGSRRGDNGEPLPQRMNDYYLAHPENVLGEVVDGGFSHIEVRGDLDPEDLRAALDNIAEDAISRGVDFSVDPTPGDASVFKESAKRLVASTVEPERPAEGVGENLLREPSQETLARRGNLLQGALIHVGTWKRKGRGITAPASGSVAGKVKVTEEHQFAIVDANGNQVPHVPSQGERDELARLLRMRDMREDLIALEKTEDDDTPQLDALRKDLAAAYDEYVGLYGPIGRMKVGWRKMTDKQVAAYQARLAKGEDPDPDVRETEGGFEKVSRTYPGMGGMRNDPSFWALLSLEDSYDEGSPDDPTDWGRATRGKILTERQMRPYEPPTTADDPDDALSIVEEKLGRIDLDEVAKVLGLDGGARTALEVLGDRVLKDHKTGEWVAYRSYISKINLRTTLRDLQGLVGEDASLQRNIDMILAAMPEDKPIAEIQTSIGATWIPTDDFLQFMRDTVGGNAASRIDLSLDKDDDGRNQWSIAGTKVGPASVIGGAGIPDDRSRDERNPDSADFKPLVARWGTSRKTFQELVQHSLNNSIPVVMDKVSIGNGFTIDVYNQAETEAAKDMLDRVQTQFAVWAKSDPERAERLERLYNDRFRSRVPANYINSRQRAFPGMNDAITLDQHQVDGVTRGVNEDSMGAAWEVGVGKTFLAAAVYAERVRLGKSRKIYHTTPNHLVEQTARELKHLYPDMKILVVDGESMKTGPKDDPERIRRRTMAQMRDGDWDVVIASESADSKILPNVDHLIADSEARLEKLREDRNRAELKGNTEKFNKVTDQIKNLEGKIEQLKDSVAAEGRNDFTSLGFDYIGIDESHRYKNDLVVGGPPNFNAAGQASKRAQHLRAKIDAVREANQAAGRDHGVLMLSGTPVTNNTREFYVALRMLRPDLLIEAGVSDFDDFYSMFLEATEDIEGTVDGGTQVKVRDGFRVKNAGELVRMWLQAWDVAKASDVGIERPELKGGAMEQVVVPMNDLQQAYYEHLQNRYATMPRKWKLEKGDDNALAIGNDGLLAAIDMRLLPDKELDAIGVDRDELTSEHGKLGTLVGKVLGVWNETKNNTYQVRKGVDTNGNEYPEHPNPGALQLIFSDVGVPGGASKSGFNLYQAIKDDLVAGGMSPDEVAFIHDAADRATMKKLTDKARAGEIKVLIGSSAKMATGLNVQDRLTNVWHLDTQKTPDVIEQRNGRAIRRGNQNAEVGIGYVTTEGTSEAWAWSVAANKDNFLREFDTADMDATVVGAPEDNAAAPLLQLKATASKDPYMIEQFRAKKDLQELERSYAIHQGQLEAANGAIRRSKNDLLGLDRMERSVESATANWHEVTSGENSNFMFRTPGGGAYSDLKDAGEALEVAIRDEMLREDWLPVTNWRALGSLGGLELQIRRFNNVHGERQIQVGVRDPAKRDYDQEKILAGATIVLDPTANIDHNTAIRLRNLVNQAPTWKQNLLDQRADKNNAIRQANEVLENSDFARTPELEAARDRMAALEKLVKFDLQAASAGAVGAGQSPEERAQLKANLEADYRDAKENAKTLHDQWLADNGGVKEAVKLGAVKTSRRAAMQATAERMNQRIEESGVPMSKAPRKVRTIADEEAAKNSVRRVRTTRPRTPRNTSTTPGPRAATGGDSDGDGEGSSDVITLAPADVASDFAALGGDVDDVATGGGSGNRPTTPQAPAGEPNEGDLPDENGNLAETTSPETQQAALAADVPAVDEPSPALLPPAAAPNLIAGGDTDVQELADRWAANESLTGDEYRRLAAAAEDRSGHMDVTEEQREQLVQTATTLRALANTADAQAAAATSDDAIEGLDVPEATAPSATTKPRPKKPTTSTPPATQDGLDFTDTHTTDGQMTIGEGIEDAEAEQGETPAHPPLPEGTTAVNGADVHAGMLVHLRSTNPTGTYDRWDTRPAFITSVSRTPDGSLRGWYWHEDGNGGGSFRVDPDQLETPRFAKVDKAPAKGAWKKAAKKDQWAQEAGAEPSVAVPTTDAYPDTVYTHEVTNGMPVRVPAGANHPANDMPNEFVEGYAADVKHTGQNVTFSVVDSDGDKIGAHNNSRNWWVATNKAQADVVLAREDAEAAALEAGASKEEAELEGQIAAADAVDDSDAYADGERVTPPPPPAEPKTPKQLDDEDYPLSPEQQPIADAVVADRLDTKVEAKAGAGKTSTLVAIAKRFALAEPDERIAYVAFNKSVQTEAEGRFPSNTEARTGHSIAFVWRGREWTDAKFDRPDALRNTQDIADHLGMTGEAAADDAALVMAAIARYSNQADDDLTLNHFRSAEGRDLLVEVSDAAKRRLLGFARKAWEDINAIDGKIAVNNDHIRKMWALSKPDFSKPGSGLRKPVGVLFLDEAQDTPPVLAKVIADQTIQKVIVGDGDQAIYGFTGATDYLEGAEADTSLPLTKSWRFGPLVADIGNRFLQLLGSKQRVIGGGGPSQITEGMDAPDAILTRSNSGMFAEIMKEQKAGRLVGVPRGTQGDLSSLIASARYLRDGGSAPKKMHEDLAPFKTWSEFEKAAEEGDDQKVASLWRLFDDQDLSQLSAVVGDLVEDGEDALAGVAVDQDDYKMRLSGKTWPLNEKVKRNGGSGVKDAGFKWDNTDKQWVFFGTREQQQAALDKLKELAGGDPRKPDVTVSTAHKSKGLEWGRVRIADDFRGPETDDNGDIRFPDPEELRLAYVAVTRAEKELDPGSLAWVFEHTAENGGDPDQDRTPAPRPLVDLDEAPTPQTTADDKYGLGLDGMGDDELDEKIAEFQSLFDKQGSQMAKARLDALLAERNRRSGDADAPAPAAAEDAAERWGLSLPKSFGAKKTIADRTLHDVLAAALKATDDRHDSRALMGARDLFEGDSRPTLDVARRAGRSVGEDPDSRAFLGWTAEDQDATERASLALADYLDSVEDFEGTLGDHLIPNTDVALSAYLRTFANAYFDARARDAAEAAGEDVPAGWHEGNPLRRPSLGTIPVSRALAAELYRQTHVAMMQGETDGFETVDNGFTVADYGKTASIHDKDRALAALTRIASDWGDRQAKGEQGAESMRRAVRKLLDQVRDLPASATPVEEEATPASRPMIDLDELRDPEKNEEALDADVPDVDEPSSALVAPTPNDRDANKTDDNDGSTSRPRPLIDLDGRDGDPTEGNGPDGAPNLGPNGRPHLNDRNELDERDGLGSNADAPVSDAPAEPNTEPTSSPAGVPASGPAALVADEDGVYQIPAPAPGRDLGYFQPPAKGSVLRTVSGRLTTPYPGPEASDRKRNQWLIDNAQMEAESRGSFFPNMVLNNLSPADHDEMWSLLQDPELWEMTKGQRDLPGQIKPLIPDTPEVARLKAAIDKAGAGLPAEMRTHEQVAAEIRDVIEPMPEKTTEKYARVRRPDRPKMNRAERLAMWRVYEAYQTSGPDKTSDSAADAAPATAAEGQDWFREAPTATPPERLDLLDLSDADKAIFEDEMDRLTRNDGRADGWRDGRSFDSDRLVSLAGVFAGLGRPVLPSSKKAPKARLDAYDRIRDAVFRLAGQVANGLIEEPDYGWVRSGGNTYARGGHHINDGGDKGATLWRPRGDERPTYQQYGSLEEARQVAEAEMSGNAPVSGPQPTADELLAADAQRVVDGDVDPAGVNDAVLARALQLAWGTGTEPVNPDRYADLKAVRDERSGRTPGTSVLPPVPQSAQAPAAEAASEPGADASEGADYRPEPLVNGVLQLADGDIYEGLADDGKFTPEQIDYLANHAPGTVLANINGEWVPGSFVNITLASKGTGWSGRFAPEGTDGEAELVDVDQASLRGLMPVESIEGPGPLEDPADLRPGTMIWARDPKTRRYHRGLLTGATPDGRPTWVDEAGGEHTGTRKQQVHPIYGLYPSSSAAPTAETFAPTPGVWTPQGDGAHIAGVPGEYAAMVRPDGSWQVVGAGEHDGKVDADTADSMETAKRDVRDVLEGWGWESGESPQLPGDTATDRDDATSDANRRIQASATGGTDTAAPVEPATGEGEEGPAETWIPNGALQPGDVAHVTGDSVTGDTADLTGHVIGVPETVKVHVPGKASKTGTQTLIADTPDGDGTRGTVLGDENAVAAHMSRPGEDAEATGPQSAGEAAVLSDSLPEQVPTDAHGRGIFPQAVVRDATPEIRGPGDKNGFIAREGRVIESGHQGVTVAWDGEDRTTVQPGSLIVHEQGARPSGWNNAGTRIKPGQIVMAPGLDAPGVVESVDGDTAVLATQDGANRMDVAGLQVLGVTDVPERPEYGFNQARAGELAAGDMILVPGGDTHVRPLEVVARTNRGRVTEIEAVDPATGEVTTFEADADDLVTRAVDADGNPMDVTGAQPSMFTAPHTAEGLDIRPVEPLPVTPLPESTRTGKVNLKPGHLPFLNDLGLDRDSVTTGDIAEAAARLRAGMELSAAQAQALAGHLLMISDRDGLERKKARAYKSIANRLAAAAERIYGNATPSPAPHSGEAVATTADDLAHGDQVALPDESGLLVGEVTDVATSPGGYVATVVVTDPAGDQHKVTTPGTTPVHRLPDIPDDADGVDEVDDTPGVSEFDRQGTARVGTRLEEAAQAVVDAVTEGAEDTHTLDELATHVEHALETGADDQAQKNSSDRLDSSLDRSGLSPEEATALREAARDAASDVAAATAEVIRNTLEDAEPLPGESQEDAAKRLLDRLKAATNEVDVEALVADAIAVSKGASTATAEARAAAHHSVRDGIRADLFAYADQLAATGDVDGANLLSQIAAKLAGNPDPIQVARVADALAQLDQQAARPSLLARARALLARARRAFAARVHALTNPGRKVRRTLAAALKAARAEWAGETHPERDTMIDNLVEETANGGLRGPASTIIDGAPAGFGERMDWFRRQLPPTPALFGRKNATALAYSHLESSNLGSTVTAKPHTRARLDRARDGGPGKTAIAHANALQGMGATLDEEINSRLRGSHPELGADPAGMVAEARAHADALDYVARAGRATAAEKAAAQAARNEADALARTYTDAYAVHAAAVIAEQRPVGRRGGGPVVDARSASAPEAQAIEWVLEQLPADWVAAMGPIEAYAGPQGSYVPGGRVTVAPLGPEQRTGAGEYGRSALHEIGHHLETTVPGLVEAQWVYHWLHTSTPARARTGRNALGSLADLFPGVGHHRSTVTRQGDFPDPWAGIENDGHQHWEILPYGLESLFGGMFADNKDMRAYVLALIVWAEIHDVDLNR